jgi:hypothetical protein
VRRLEDELADVVLATAETPGTVFEATFADGYLGEEKMDVGPVDLRLAGGLLVGIYKTMSGDGGNHALALGNGLGRGHRSPRGPQARGEEERLPAAARPAPAAAPACRHRRDRPHGPNEQVEPGLIVGEGYAVARQWTFDTWRGYAVPMR